MRGEGSAGRPGGLRAWKAEVAKGHQTLTVSGQECSTWEQVTVSASVKCKLKVSFRWEFPSTSLFNTVKRRPLYV